MNNVFVFDTNVLISASIRNNSVSRQALDRALQTGVVVYSSDVLEELITRLARAKFDKYLRADEKVRAISRFKLEALRVEVADNVEGSRDPDDNKFLSLAVAMSATCIISGDKKHLLTLHPFRGIPIVFPADFLKMF